MRSRNIAGFTAAFTAAFTSIFATRYYYNYNYRSTGRRSESDVDNQLNSKNYRLSFNGGYKSIPLVTK